MPRMDRPRDEHADLTLSSREEGQELERAQGESAKDRVLSSPDLLERILALLPTPCLLFLRDFCGAAPRVDYRERWSAAHVNRHFRQAALRLPWAAQWDQNSGRACSGYLDVLCTPRNLQSVALWGLCQDKLAQCVSLVGCASRLSSMRVVSDSEDTLLQFLRAPHVLSPWHGLPAVGPAQSRPVLAGLSSLTHLSLSVTSRPWRDVVWLTALQCLKDVELVEYGGPPLAGLPHLETLQLVRYRNSLQAALMLKQWASPRLTAMSFMRCPPVHLDSISSSPSGQEPDTEASAPRTWLRGLKRLRLPSARVSQQSAGLRELVPSLTFLELGMSHRDHSFAVLSKGLPLQLQRLDLSYGSGRIPSLLWSVIRELSSLVSLTVRQTQGKVPRNFFEAAVDCLCSLSQLRKISLGMAVVNGVGLEERMRAAKLLAWARGVEVELSTPVRR